MGKDFVSLKACSWQQRAYHLYYRESFDIPVEDIRSGNTCACLLLSV